MAKWEIPNEQEWELLRERGRNPDKYVVNRVGEDQLVFLEHRPRLDPIPREELYIRLENKKKSSEKLGERIATSLCSSQ